MKKLLAVLMAAIMVMSLGVSVLAEDITYSITITNANSGETYKAYKVFDATISESGTDGQGNATYNVSYTIDSTSAWYTVIKDSDDNPFTFTQVGNTTTYTVSLTNESTSADTLGTFFASLSVSLSESDVAASEVASGSSLTLTVDDAGYYYITTTTGSVVSLTSATPTASVTDKNTAPTVTKQVSDDEDGTYGQTSTASIGDTVYYYVKIANINDVEKLVFHDAMSAGLTFDSSSVVVKIDFTGSDSTLTTVESTNYALTTTSCSSSYSDCDFEIFLTSYLTTESVAEQLTDNSYIVITYTATVNPSAEIGNSTGNTNEANVSYGNASATETSTSSKTTTYVYEMSIYKYTGTLDTSNPSYLAGASFMLYDSNKSAFAYFSVSGTTYTFVGWSTNITESVANEKNYTSTLTSVSTGLITIKGLDVNTYYLLETEAPSGYNKLTDYVKVSITASESDYSETLTYTDSSTASNTIDGTSYVVAIVNETGSTLPTTGGIGTTIFYVVGAVLVIGAAVILITRRRMGNRA